MLSRALPKLSAMAAVKYAPPATPPRKKYQTISIVHCGFLSIAASASASPVAEAHHDPQADGDRGPDGEERIHHDVPLRELRVVGQLVRRRLRQEQEERVEAAQEAVLVGPVELRVREALGLQRLHPLLGL